VVEKVCKKVYRTKVGSPYVVSKMKERVATLGLKPKEVEFFQKCIAAMVADLL
jgi:hypothetical protein